MTDNRPLRPRDYPDQVVAALRLMLREARGYEANLYGVGGFARDVVRGGAPGDVDVTIAGHAVEVSRRVANELGAACVALHTDPDIARIVLPDRSSIDVADLRARTIEQDLAQRDFTINAIGFRLAAWLDTGQLDIVDPVGGRHDLAAGRLHLGYPNAIAEDPVRALRGIRFLAQLGLRPTPVTLSSIGRAALSIAQSPGERVRDELVRFLRVARTAEPFLLLQRLGLLFAVFPELQPADGCSQPREHYWDVLRHSIETTLALWSVRQDLLEVEHGPWLLHELDAVTSGDRTRMDVLRLVALLHDVAKPSTRAIHTDGRMRFFGHGEAGADQVSAIFRRLRFSSAEAGMAATATTHHLRPGMLQSPGEDPTPKALYRYFRDTNPVGLDLLVLNLADHRAARGPLLDSVGYREHLRLVSFVASWERSRRQAKPAEPLVRGDDLLQELGLPPGPEIGRLLALIDESRQSGEVTTRDDALRLARASLRGS